MLLQLVWDQVAVSDLHLLLLGVAWKQTRDEQLKLFKMYSCYFPLG